MYSWDYAGEAWTDSVMETSPAFGVSDRREDSEDIPNVVKGIVKDQRA